MCDQIVRVIYQATGEGFPSIPVGAFYDGTKEDECSTGSDGRCTLHLEDGKNYKLAVLPPSGYPCVHCEEDIVACTSEITFILKYLGEEMLYECLKCIFIRILADGDFTSRDLTPRITTGNLIPRLTCLREVIPII